MLSTLHAMHVNRSAQSTGTAITVAPVTQETWRAVYALQVTAAQRAFVAEPGYYLALCCYGELWRPLAMLLDAQAIGFLMWAVDPADGSCWLGGILVDQQHQRRGYGRQAINATLDLLAREQGFRAFALSYQPANLAARRLYASMGFVESGEWEDDGIVARLRRDAP
ncbi:GNAT family N-acetyltransferase [Caldilinea sp.]|uniref:GNAT family N-acetyltransferase n=1 Tax=Caldilinea sp. TaxID=2293560 RepID=UPI002C6D7CA9|nr:GNAT family N-acetyltransferase [Caldilinea sp.]HRA66890.1 GNAT family N-acetyltransferase [Caldilinea sp.]